ncbi:bifunctional phosphopantothenoylcysteine decarboxylase/phosphopantothenate--cysteine ligase CoaBC [Halobacteriales archaeon SW_7_68_16]|nr:MAG: bifunctional phosphopantothenoylcysteine decarboxylase/phosphopantothenate--cysteine ligase CoaBC [Halobacteriales archaeon SW_7_68_16]
MLSGVNVVLGVTGSIAAVRVVELAHELRRHGATVRAVMTEGARGIVHPWAVEFATDEVVTELTGRVEHVALCGREGWGDVLLLAPATANTVGKIAAAIDDTPVTTCATTAIGADLPVVVVPAMHEPMYDHPGVVDAIDRLESWGIEVVDPRIEEGKAKIATDDAIALATARAAGDRPLDGRRVVVTAGATAEPIDPVRIVTNRASGRTGHAVARACHVRGADVTVVEGTIREPTVAPYEVVPVETTAELRDAAVAAAADADAYVSAAAIGDYTVDAAPEKLPSGESLRIDMHPTTKVVDAVHERRPDLPMIGFKIETTDDEAAMVTAARDLADRIGLAVVFANDATVMGETETSGLFVTADDTERFVGSKGALGAAVADRIVALL